VNTKPRRSTAAAGEASIVLFLLTQGHDDRHRAGSGAAMRSFPEFDHAGPNA